MLGIVGKGDVRLAWLEHKSKTTLQDDYKSATHLFLSIRIIRCRVLSPCERTFAARAPAEL